MSNGSDDDDLDLKTKRAWTDKREKFSPNDINDSAKLLRMRASSGLWDDDLNDLIIVPKGKSSSTRKPTRAHFKLKSGEPRTPIHRDSADPTHNDAVDELQKRLATKDASLQIVSKGWNADNTPNSNPFWTQHCLSDYTWHKEPGTRLLMECGDFIQPDIVGIDTKRMNRTAQNPAIIIEVVHHHWPEKATFAHLKKLSTLNCIVAFYFVKKGLKENNFANSLKLNGAIATLNTASFLVRGTFMHEGEVVDDSSDPEVDYLKFNQIAKAAAEKAFAKQAAKAKAEAEAKGNVK